MFAATFGFAVLVVIGLWISLICLGVFTWPGERSATEKIIAVIVAVLVVLFLRWVNPFAIDVVVTL